VELHRGVNAVEFALLSISQTTTIFNVHLSNIDSKEKKVKQVFRDTTLSFKCPYSKVMDIWLEKVSEETLHKFESADTSFGVAKIPFEVCRSIANFVKINKKQ
jgi:hypothetical protein